MKDYKILYTTLALLIITSLIGLYTSYHNYKDAKNTSIAMQQLFIDYCRDKGNITKLKDVEVYLPEVGEVSDYDLLSCVAGDQYGILVYDREREVVRYYIPESD